MRIVAGLGNPGEQYAFTRHNMGWLCADFIAVNNNLGRPQEKFHAEFWKMNDVILLKPLTFMNASGISLAEAVNFYKAELSDVLIVYDDKALPFGKLRLRAQGTAGGHNGLASVLGALGDLHVPRLRIGIGHPTCSMIDYVLGHFPPDEREQLPKVIERAADAVDVWLKNDIQRAMTIVNADENPSV